VRLIPARSHAPRDPLQAIHCAVEGMDAKRSAAVLLSSSAAAQRCAEGAGLDSGTVAAAQSAMPSIAARGRTDCKQYFHWCRRIRRPSATIPNLHQLDGRDHSSIWSISSGGNVMWTSSRGRRGCSADEGGSETVCEVSMPRSIGETPEFYKTRM